MRRVRHLHRHLPGGRADQRHLSLSDAALGNEARRHHLHALRRTAARPRWAFATTRSFAATIATAPASTASSCASRAATRSISCNSPERLQSPMMRRNGELEPMSWSEALATVGAKVQRSESARRQVRRDRFEPHHQRRELLPAEVRARRGWAPTISIIIAPAIWRRCSTRSAARRCAGDDRRSVRPQGDPGGRAAISRSSIRSWRSRFAPTSGITTRTSTRSRPVRCASRSTPCAASFACRAANWPTWNRCASKLKAEPELVILFGDAIKGDAVRKLVAFGDSLGIPVKYVCLVDYSNSRGAFDMGLCPDCSRISAGEHARHRV